MAFSTLQARKLQEEMAQKVVREDAFGSLRWIGGVDLSYRLYDPKAHLHAAAVLYDSQEKRLVEVATASIEQTIPYIPGFLGFREVPALVAACAQLKQRPDLILVDGHGIAHPRGLGVASHLGLELDLPTIGVAKSLLVGEPAFPLAPEAGSQAPLLWKGNLLGMLYRSKRNAHPLIISIGHRICLESALEVVKATLQGYRLPEPTRQAHLAANQAREGSSRIASQAIGLK